MPDEPIATATGVGFLTATVDYFICAFDVASGGKAQGLGSQNTTWDLNPRMTAS
jgi:glucose dehydrogenase